MPQQFVQNPLEQFEPERLPVGWPWRFFSVSLIIFSATLLLYLGLVFGYKPFLNSSIQKKDAEISKISQTVTKEDQEQFIKFYSQLANLKLLLDNHSVSSKVFPALEQMTNKKVFYKSANLKVPERELELDGVAESYGVLSEQLEAFNKSDGVERFILGQSQAGESGVQFKATLKLKANLLK